MSQLCVNEYVNPPSCWWVLNMNRGMDCKLVLELGSAAICWSPRSNDETETLEFHGSQTTMFIDYPLVNQHNYGKSTFLMCKSTIMAMFNSYVKLPEGSTGEYW